MRRGRPPIGSKLKTRLVRAYEDTAEMLYWVSRERRMTTAAYIEELLRGQVEADFAPIRQTVERIKKHEKAARAVIDELGKAGA